MGSKITADVDHSHEIKRNFLLRRKAMTNLDSILKSTDVTFADKGPSSPSYGFSTNHYGYESWTIKKAECQGMDACSLEEKL